MIGIVKIVLMSEFEKLLESEKCEVIIKWLLLVVKVVCDSYGLQYGKIMIFKEVFCCGFGVDWGC